MPTELSEVPEELVVDFDIFDPSLTDPVDRVQDVVGELAAIAPIVYSTAYGGHWVVTEYSAVHEILRTPEVFSSYPNSLVDVGMGRVLPVETDPPYHTAIRNALVPLFSPARMRALEDDIRRMSVELLDTFAAAGRCDFANDFAYELPARVFFALMGWPMQEAEAFIPAVRQVFSADPGDAPQRIFGYFHEVLARRRAGAVAEDDVTAKVMNTKLQLEDVERDPTDDELVRMFFQLMIAGLHTVQGSLSWAMVYLSTHPEQRQKIIDDPALIRDAVEEVLRIEAAVTPGRSVVVDTNFRGRQFKKGDQVILMLCSANRDRQEFEDPNVFDIDRTNKRHLSFGAGIHRCLGSHLARIELQIALDEIHRRIPDYRLDPEHPPVILPTQVRSLPSLPIVFTPVN